jgi:hypothetical protein
MFQDMDRRDTTYVPTGDMSDLGNGIQVLSNGVLFPLRGNKLDEVHKRYAPLPSLMMRLENISKKWF